MILSGQGWRQPQRYCSHIIMHWIWWSCTLHMHLPCKICRQTQKITKNKDVKRERERWEEQAIDRYVMLWWRVETWVCALLCACGMCWTISAVVELPAPTPERTLRPFILYFCYFVFYDYLLCGNWIYILCLIWCHHKYVESAIIIIEHPQMDHDQRDSSMVSA